MATHGLDTSLHEMKDSHEKLSARKLAMQVYLQQGVTDETKAWLQAQIAAHAERIALLEGVMGGMTSLAATDYPELDVGDMPAEVQENLDTLDAKLAKTREAMTSMRTKPSAQPDTSQPPIGATTAGPRLPEGSDIDQAQRRGRRENA